MTGFRCIGWVINHFEGIVNIIDVFLKPLVVLYSTVAGLDLLSELVAIRLL